MEFDSAEEVASGVLRLRSRRYCGGTDTPERYRILMKLQLTKPGGGRRPSKFRNVLASACCSTADGPVEFLLPGYLEKWRLDMLPGYSAHGQYIVLDAQTGFRDQLDLRRCRERGRGSSASGLVSFLCPGWSVEV